MNNLAPMKKCPGSARYPKFDVDVKCIRIIYTVWLKRYEHFQQQEHRDHSRLRLIVIETI